MNHDFSVRLVTRLAPLALAVPAFAAPAFVMGDWYVAPNPNGPGTGTQADPYATIQSAIDAPTTLAGDVLHVRAGEVYHESVNLNGKALAVHAWFTQPGQDLPTIDAGGAGACFAANFNEYGSALVDMRLRNGHAAAGGGIVLGFCTITVIGCEFVDNVANDYGGAVVLHPGAQATFDRCIFRGNRTLTAVGRGGAVAGLGGAASFDHATFWGNAASQGGAMFLYTGILQARNSILWANTGGDIAFRIDAPMPALNHCVVQSTWPGIGNLSIDPVLWNPWGGNFHLNYGSQCRDAGDPASPLDPDGTITDIGTYFFYAGDGNELVTAVNGGDSFCVSHGSDPSQDIVCPCGNDGFPGHGCAHSASAFGAVLTAAPAASATLGDEVVLHAYGMPATSSCIYFKGDQRATPGVVFGDGVRCVDGALLRIGMKTNVAGGSQYPSNGIEDPLSVRSQTPIGSGLVAHYQVYFRNAAAFCTPDTFNATNGYSVTW